MLNKNFRATWYWTKLQPYSVAKATAFALIRAFQVPFSIRRDQSIMINPSTDICLIEVSIYADKLVPTCVLLL